MEQQARLYPIAGTLKRLLEKVSQINCAVQYILVPALIKAVGAGR